MRRPVIAGLFVALVLGACGLRPGTPGESSTSIPLCESVPRVSAPADWYRDSPIYVANEQPTEAVRAWAAGKPGFEEIWIDRDHLGWITVAFSVDAEARQAELEELFPDAGVVAVEVDWTMEELEEVQQRVHDELGPLFPVSSGIFVSQGVVGIGLGVLEDEHIAAIEERFGGQPICVEGADPADVPSQGPQPQGGEGWRLLADQRGVGQPYRTGIATDQASYDRLWTDIGLSGAPPPVDFESDVVIWFGAVYGGTCPIQLNDVVIDEQRALVHADIVLVGSPMACTDDANPHAYLVAVERGRLPSAPFAIQLGADDPPAAAPEERTLVDVDLSRPGSVAGPGDVHGDPSLPEPYVLESGSVIEPGYPAPYRMFVHCGIEWLGILNDVAWRADPNEGNLKGVPPPWEAIVDADLTLELSVVLETDPEPVIEATANGHTVTYRPTTEEPPGCD